MSPNPLTAGLRPTHPGEILREDVLPSLGKSKVEIAKLFGVSRAALCNMIAERAAITPDMALRLGKLLGGAASVWPTMQQTYDLRTREKELATALSKIPRLAAAE
jgi:addiction module HigA family antidote